jgi:hypothetical protein
MEAEPQTSPTYLWQTHCSLRLAQLHCASRDLRECRSFLCHATDPRFEQLAESFVSAALLRYRLAFDGVGWFTVEDADSMEADNLALHEWILAAAGQQLHRSVNAFEQTKVGVVTTGDEVDGIELMPLDRIYWNVKLVRQWTCLIDLIERAIVQPKLKLVEEVVLKEAKAFGIQLVRFLPVLMKRGHEPAPNQGPSRTVNRVTWSVGRTDKLAYQLRAL